MTETAPAGVIKTIHDFAASFGGARTRVDRTSFGLDPISGIATGYVEVGYGCGEITVRAARYTQQRQVRKQLGTMVSPLLEFAALIAWAAGEP